MRRQTGCVALLVAASLVAQAPAIAAAATATPPTAAADGLIVGYVKHDETTDIKDSTGAYAGSVHMEYTFEGTWDELLNRDADWHELRASATGTANLIHTWVSGDGDCAYAENTTWLGPIGNEYGPEVLVDWQTNDQYRVSVSPSSLWQEDLTSSCGEHSSRQYDGMWAGWDSGDGYADAPDPWWVFPGTIEGHTLSSRAAGTSEVTFEICWKQPDHDTRPVNDPCPPLDPVADSDGDGIKDGVDNCPSDYNPGQQDFDRDGVGDACDDEDSDGDGLTDADERSRETNPRNPDTDGDTLPDGQEVELATNPLDRDSDDGGVRDDREVLIKASDPLIAADDIPLPYETYWHGLVNKAAADYKLARRFGDATKGYYHQVLNLVCSAAGVDGDHRASKAAMKYCPAMREAVKSGYGEWAGDFPYEVFASFLPTVTEGEIAGTGKEAKVVAHALCAAAATSLGPVAGVTCERHLDDLGFTVAGTIHAAHHLYPNFVRHAERIIRSADGGARLQNGILTGNMIVMRRQHQLLFDKAVKPGFKAVFEVSGPYKWIAKTFVPFAASCEREHAIRDAMRHVLGKSRGDKTFRATDPAGEGDIVNTTKCKAWIRASHLLPGT